MDGQTEISNHILEDLLQMYVMDRPTKWEEFLHLAEFSYNNNHQTFLKMILFEALYRKKCHTPLWSQCEHILILGEDDL